MKANVYVQIVYLVNSNDIQTTPASVDGVLQYAKIKYHQVKVIKLTWCYNNHYALLIRERNCAKKKLNVHSLV